MNILGLKFKLQLQNLKNVNYRKYTGWAKKTAPSYIFLFIVLVYLFTFTNNISCELKFCPTYIEAQTNLVCQQVVQKKLQQSQSTPTSLCHNGKTQQQCMLVPISKCCVQQPDSQVNNCSMLLPRTWTTAFNRGRHWSMIRIRQQVRLLASEDMKLQICLSDLSHRTAGYSCQLFNIYGAFAGPRLVFLTWLHISSATWLILCSILTVLGCPLPGFRKIEFVVSILRRRSLTELTAHFFKKLFTKYVLRPIPFLDEGI